MPQVPFRPIDYLNSGNFLLSAGNHCLKLVKTSQEKTKEGEPYFKFSFQVADESSDKGKIWTTYFNIQSPNEDRCRIAREQVTAFFNIAGFNLEEYCYTEDLEGKTFSVNIKHSVVGDKTYANIQNVTSELKEIPQAVTAGEMPIPQSEAVEREPLKECPF